MVRSRAEIAMMILNKGDDLPVDAAMRRKTSWYGFTAGLRTQVGEMAPWK